MEACNFITKEALAQVLSCEFCEISKNNFFTENLWTTASDVSNNYNFYFQTPSIAIYEGLVLLRKSSWNYLSLDTVQKFNVHKKFKRHAGRLLNVLKYVPTMYVENTFQLCLVSRELGILTSYKLSYNVKICADLLFSDFSFCAVSFSWSSISFDVVVITDIC